MSVPAQLVLGTAVTVDVGELLGVGVECDVEQVRVGVGQRGADDDELAVVDRLSS